MAVVVVVGVVAVAVLMENGMKIGITMIDTPDGRWYLQKKKNN